MALPQSIPRRKAPAEEYSFEALRSFAIACVQEMAGNIWTDYNLHDPGVTILEQVCYALTDIAYRADFPIADFLVDDKGSIDWRRQGLLPPEAALPTRATTASDYREIFLDAVPELEDVKIEPTPGRPTGLYNITLTVRKQEPPAHPEHHAQMPAAPKSAAEANEAIVTQVRDLFARKRNLCEDINDLHVEPVEDNALRLSVYISEGADHVSTLASIHQAFANRLSSALHFVPYETALLAGATPEEMFRGPLLQSGILSRDPQTAQTGLPQADIRAMVEAIPGVLQVSASAPIVTASLKSSATTQTFNKIDVKLLCNNRELTSSSQDLQSKLEDLDQPSQNMRATLPTHGIVPLPKGTVRNLSEYLSVQYHFPAIYGVGPEGVPDWVPAEQQLPLDRQMTPARLASARQLQAYLLFFDQNMADLLANLAHLRELYSTAIDKRRSSYSQLLSADTTPGLAALYNSTAVARMQATHDAEFHYERVTRLIDYLIALYGESFPDGPLLGSVAHAADADQDKVVDARLAYLKRLDVITGDRFSAVDIWNTSPAGPQRSGLEEKLSHLLGFEAEIASTGIHLAVIEHILLRPKDWKPADKPTLEFRISVLLPGWPARCAEPSFRMYATQIVDTCCPAHIYADIYWLDQGQMKEFDGLHRNWIGSLREEGHRRRLTDFLARIEHAEADQNATAKAGESTQ